MTAAPHPMGNRARRDAASLACCAAGIMPRGRSYSQTPDSVRFDVTDLAEHLRLPAAALLHAALAHYLCPPFDSVQMLMRWCGASWVIEPWSADRLHVTMLGGTAGMLTPPCAQLEGLYQ